MSTLTVELPDGLHTKTRQIAAAKNLTMHALASIAPTQNLSRLTPATRLQARAARATGKGLEEFLGQLPDVEPPKWDTLAADRKQDWVA